MSRKIESKMREALVTSVMKTLSDMAFIDAVEITNQTNGIIFSHIIHIFFFDPEEGEIALVLPTEAKKLIVENIYGQGWESLQAIEIDDCLLEILNVLAGNFLNELCGREAKHDISLPELLFDVHQIKESGEFSCHYFDAEGVVFKVLIRLKGSKRR
jgi:CheY-specific phosphatase CheX